MIKAVTSELLNKGWLALLTVLWLESLLYLSQKMVGTNLVNKMKFITI